MDIMKEYNAWLHDFADDAATRAELEAIRDNPAEIEDRFYTNLSFGTAGMRGVLGAGTNRMNIYNVRRAAAGFADYLLDADPNSRTRGVVIAYDSRRMSDRFAEETALIFCARGIAAHLFDALRPVPVLSFAVRHLNAAAGVVITASHNPPEYNGFKVYGEDGAQLSPEAAAQVTSRIAALRYQDCVPMPRQEALDKGLLHLIGNAEVDDDYIRMVLSLAVRPDLLKAEGKNLRIVYTPLHGSGNVPVRRVLAEASIENVTVVPEQEHPDPDFSTVSAPNPENPDAFSLAIPLARKVGASVIFGTDPDCDRLGVCVQDADGVFRTLTGNQIGCLLLHHILTGRKASGTLPENGACIKSIVTTELARAISASFGVEQFDVLTGFKFVGELIQQFEETGSHEFLFGFEESFGYLSGTQVRDKDGVNASLLIAEAACVCLHEGITLYDRLQQIFRDYGWYAEQVLSKTLPGKDGLADMRAIMERLRANPPDAIGGVAVTAVRDYLAGTRIADGRQEALNTPPSNVLYYELAGGHWLCVRPSGTEPKIKVYVNTRSDESMADAEALCARLTEAGEAMLA
ncbi:MAG: phospho-sugar mutase [Clostridiales bacterium]|nr:phospho-sugar mutase [Clostridiales bacterium]